ncbi:MULTISPECIES: hypothetical protein [unclassified Isoptericola]|uniref:hypothetical protein n=1 Tax=unclassified Isoptericola TaxID=2623355 RepID=UPI0027131432|nr:MULTISPECIES: hypothetical protein [unclassified Isoptericola]MDO8145546.1 hypothetical protein [Isoptericola sp. 178]MDO8149258.1 hypothetical protein [Isoptericola sp. b515]MDO8152197.1 hypothetical protein [Isoptericola sp. b408]
MDQRDEAFDRLTAADPAAGVETRHGVLRAKTDALREEQGGPAHGSADELAVARARRRSGWLVAAGVAGAVALTGGGYAVGVAEGGGAGPTVADGALPPISLDGGAGGEGGVVTEERALGGQAATDPAVGTSVMPAPGFGGRVTFSQEGLSTEPGTAAALAYDAADVATESGAADLAAALDVAGEPRWEFGSWAVGPRDGSGPSLWLAADGIAYFSYTDPTLDPWRCEEVEVLPEESTESQGAIEPAPCPVPDGETVPAEDAADGLRELMTAVGADPAEYEVEVAEASGVGRRAVAYQVVEGRRTGATWSVTVTEDGVAWADGFLAETVSLGDYPVVSPAEAVERLGDPRFGQQTWPIAYADDTVSGLEPSTRQLPAPDAVEPDLSEPTVPPAPPSSGSDLSWPVRDVTITGARLGLAQEFTADQGVLLLPAYELTDADGSTWSVVAVAEEALDTTSR